MGREEREPGKQGSPSEPAENPLLAALRTRREEGQPGGGTGVPGDARPTPRMVAPSGVADAPAPAQRVQGRDTEGAPPYDPAEVEARGWARVRSAVLGDDLLLVLRPEAVAPALAAHPALPTFSPREVDQLAALPAGLRRDAVLRAVAATKRVFGGRVVPADRISGVASIFQEETPPEPEEDARES